MNSNLQIISGKFRGKKLRLPPNGRPTQNRARIALFNMLAAECPNPAAVWDAFAGSGAFGAEWLSRVPGVRAIFTDTDAEAIKTIKKNLADLPAPAATILQTNAIAAISKFGAFADIVFVDPPYSDAALGAEFVRKLSSAAKPCAIIAWEMEKNFALPPLPENLKILKDKTYGRARFLIMCS